MADTPYIRKDGTVTTRLEEAKRIWSTARYDFQLQYTAPENEEEFRIIELTCTTKDAELLGNLLEHHKVPVDEFYPQGVAHGEPLNTPEFLGWTVLGVEENLE